MRDSGAARPLGASAVNPYTKRKLTIVLSLGMLGTSPAWGVALAMALRGGSP